MAPLEVFANVASTAVSSGGTTAPSAGTSESWSVVSSASFPAVHQGATQFHVADPALPGEIAAVTKVAGSSWTVTRGAVGTTPVAHAPGFTAVQVVPAGALQAMQYKDWQFPVEAYGAVGDGKVLADVVTNSTTTITSASAGFVNATAPAGDVGKYIMIHGANGATSAPLLTTIASVTNSTTAVLAAAAAASVSNCPAVYGTDDTAAINGAVTAAAAYALANSYYCEVVFGAKAYILGTGPTQAGNGTSTVTTNTQIPVPYPAAAGTTQKLIFKMTGQGAGYTQYWQATTPQVSGTSLVSILPTQPGNSISGSTGAQSVVGGPAWGTTGINPGFPSTAGGPGFANVKPVVKGISVWLPVFTNISAWDFGGCCQAEVRSCNAQVFAPSGVNGGVQPYLQSLPASSTFKSTISTGFTSPQFQNNADLYWDDCTVQGYECSFRVYDHFRANTLRAVYADVALNIDRNSTNLSHLVSISNMDAEAYNGGIQGPGNSGMSHIDITWSAECSGVAYDVSDPNNTLYGRFHFQDSADQSRGITITGAAHLKVITDELGPGHMASPPSVPLTTAAAAQVWRDAWVTVHTGAGVTVSAITVDGTATGLTLAVSSTVAVRVPSGKTIALTYAGGTPTWDWWLD